MAKTMNATDVKPGMQFEQIGYVPNPKSPTVVPPFVVKVDHTKDGKAFVAHPHGSHWIPLDSLTSLEDKAGYKPYDATAQAAAEAYAKAPKGK